MSAFEGILPEVLVDELPEPRRTLHRRAVRVLERHERDGVPFALMLRTYAISQLFGTSEGHPGRLFENILLEALEPAGIGVIQVQLPEPGAVADVLYDPQGGSAAVQAPSLFVDATRWWKVAIALIVRAELIVVLVPQVTPGVGLELDAIAAGGRADRTVVLVSGEDLGGPEDRTVALLERDNRPDTSQTLGLPILRTFPRVFWVGDLDPLTPLDAFVFRDLVKRIRIIRRISSDRRRRLTREGGLNAAHPVSLNAILAGYELLAPAHRAQNRSDVAAMYYGVAARLALSFGHVPAAIDHAKAGADLSAMLGRPREGHDALTEIRAHFDDYAGTQWSDDPDLVRVHAKLVAEQARMLTHAREIEAAKRLLQDEAVRCSSPLNRTALSTLRTELAWTLRTGTDPDAVLAVGSEAFELARAEGTAHEMSRALMVMGATLHDLGDLAQAESLLIHAIKYAGPDRHHQDRWRALLRLGEVLQAQGRTVDARAAFRRAVTVAEDGSYGWCAKMARERLMAVQ